jgi:UDPglucose 6-dehydrogenase
VASIAVIGSGVVGQATGRGLASWGHELVFCDRDPAVLADLAGRGERAVTPAELEAVHTDLTFVSVSTPTVDGHIQIDALRAAARTAARRLALGAYPVVVLRSTAPPGTTTNIVVPLLEEESGLTYGRDFGVCYNPEFLREACALDDFLAPWLVVIGAEDERSLAALRALYDAAIPEVDVIVTDFTTAEMVKYASNLLNATKISFTNELWLACRRLGIDGNEVMSAASRSAEASWNPGYGIKGGYPYGGACLPKDTVAFYAFARSLGLSMDLLRSVIDVNERVAELVQWESPLARQRGVAAPRTSRARTPA